MNELYKDKLSTLDDLMLTAFKAIFSEVINKELPGSNDIDTNEMIGQKFRAYEEAKRIIDKGFIEIQNCRLNKTKKKTFNKAL